METILAILLVLLICLAASGIYLYVKKSGINTLLAHYPAALVTGEEEHIISEFSKIGINYQSFTEAMNPSYIATIQASPSLNAAVVHYINFFDGLCAFTAKKVFDAGTVRELYGGYIVKTYNKFPELIKNQRKADKNEELWQYLEMYAKKWAGPDPRYDKAV